MSKNIDPQKLKSMRDFIRETINSDVYKNELNPIERRQLKKFFRQRYEEALDRANAPYLNEVKAYEDTEAQFLEQNKKDQGVLGAITGPIYEGAAIPGMALGNLAAFGLDAVGANETADWLSSEIKGRQQTLAETMPSQGKTISEMSLGDVPRFAYETVAKNVPLMLMTGGAGQALTGAKVLGSALSPAMAGGAATYGLMSLPEMYAETGKPITSAVFAVPHAIIENLAGLTPGRVSSWLSKLSPQDVGKKGFRDFLYNSIKTGLGEGGEEVAQKLTTIAAKHFADKPFKEAISAFVAEVKDPTTREQLKTEFAGGSIFGLMGGGYESAISNISAKINDPKTTPEEAQKLAATKKQLKDEMLQLTYNQNIPTVQPSGPIIKDPTAESFQEPEGELIHPQQTFGGPAPEILYPDAQPPQNIGTEGTMRDYAAYKQDQQATIEEQNATPIAVLRKIAAMKSVPDSDPQKQRFMKFLAERNWLPQEATEYPAGRVGQELQALDAAEMMPETLVSAEATPETPLLPYQANQAEGRILADNGGVILPVKTEDFVMPKSGRPFTNQKIAKAYQAKNEMKDTHVITPVRGGFALMKKPVQQQAKRITVETPRGGTYDTMTVSKNIPTENRMRVSGTPGVAERIEKKLTTTPDNQPTVKQPESAVEQKPARPKAAEKNAWEMSDIELAAEEKRLNAEIAQNYDKFSKTLSSRSKPVDPSLQKRLDDVQAALRGGKPWQVSFEKAKRMMPQAAHEKMVRKAFAEGKPVPAGVLAEYGLERKPIEPVNQPAYKIPTRDEFFDAAVEDSMPRRMRSDRGSVLIDSRADGIYWYDIQKGKGLMPPPGARAATYGEYIDLLYDKRYGKAEPAPEVVKQPAAPAYKVESFSGGFRVLDPQGKQYSWHTSKQAADDKATDLNSGKTAPVTELKAAEATAKLKEHGAVKTKQEKAKKPADKIEDFGEVLHGARKLYSQEFADKFSKSDDIANQPLSKSWPEPDYKKLIESGMNPKTVSFLRALRDSLPDKPRTGWKMNRWLPIAKNFKEMARKLIAGEVTGDSIVYTTGERETSDLRDLARLYDELGHDVSLKGVTIRNSRFFFIDGKKLDVPQDLYTVIVPSKKIDMFSNFRGEFLGYGKTKEAAIEDFKKKLPAFIAGKTGPVSKPKKETKFSVYQRRKGPDADTYFIAYKVGSNILDLKTGFKTGKEAIDYRNNNRAELEAILASKKELQAERRSTNSPRSGIARRVGNITPQQFADAFGFRGVQFGNWVEGDKRQTDLNEAYDALMDLAAMLNISPKALSLNGELGLAFGSRGHGGKNAPLAHYEPGNVVINLTKRKGAGSLAHEWFHALDNYFGKLGRFSKFASEGAADFNKSRLLNARDEIKLAFHNLMKTIKNSTKMEERGKARDAARSKAYWSEDLEIAARSFENYIVSKLSDAQISNDYLANIVSEEAYQSKDEEVDDYPYLKGSEIESVKYAFDNLFNAIQQEKTDKGIKLYSFEYLVAKYASAGVQKAASIIRTGISKLASSVTKFADWARAMLKQFGKTIGPKLRAMFADLTAILKNRTGAISGRPASTVTGKTTGQVLNRPAKMKDFQWKKENFRTVNLEYTSPDTGKVTKVAKLLKVNNKWFWADTNREFLTLATAAKTVKSEIFEKVRNTEREQVKIIEEARARRTAKQAKATKKVEAYLSQPTAAEEVTKKELPVTVADKISTYADRITRALFDRRLMLKKVQKLIELVSDKKLPDWANPYDRFDVVDGRIETNKGEFKDKYWQPIMADLDKAKISYEDFNNFVYAMHAPERNKYINEINPGFREKGVAGSGWTNEKAAQVKAELFAKYGEDTLMEAGKKFWAMHSELLNKQVEYGLIDEEIKGIIDAKYKYYTPLKRIKDDSVILDARALGRRSEAQDQLMFSLAAIDTTFGRGEHNRVMQAFARMALLNPAEQFYEIQKDKLKPYFDERTGEVQYRLDLWADRENTIHAKFGGRDVAIVVKDKDLLTAIKTKNSEAEPLFQLLRPINRIISAVNTAYNPDFTLSNIFRDVQTAGIHASEEESWEMAKGILSSVPGAVKTSYQYHQGIENEDTRMYKEFLREGGKTGYSEIYQLQSLAEKLEKEMAERQANGAWYQTKQGISRVMSAVSAANDIAESATRFAGYQAARKSGMTAQKAAVFAKNLTINFNKKGTYGNVVNALYVFGNPSLQGSYLTARLVVSMAKRNKGRIALAAMIGLGAMSDFLNRLISDFDDEEGRSYYDKISSDIKDNNFIVMLPGTGGNYMSFPMAYGLNILPALGRNASSYLFGDQTLRETAMNILGAGMGAFNPMGNDNRGLLANLTPTALKPLHDLTTNTKWSGRKIRPDQPVFGADLPQSELYFDQTSKPLVKFTQWLNEAFGGNKYESSSFLTDISPADMQHLIETFSGGVGKTIVRSADTIGRVASGKPVQVENVPIIRRFIGKARDFNVYDEFRANAQIAKRVQAAKGDDDKEWLNNNRESVKVNVMFKNVQKAVETLRKNKSLSDETRKEKELILQKRFNKNVREIMQKNLSKN